ncbi:MAG: four helix bundle protein [Bacteroidales bacterium]
MFDFEKLTVYQKAKKFNDGIVGFLADMKFEDPISHEPIRRSSQDIMRNIAEGSGQITKDERGNFYIMARRALYDCIVDLEILVNLQHGNREGFMSLYHQAEELSKILFAKIKKLKPV